MDHGSSLSKPFLTSKYHKTSCIRWIRYPPILDWLAESVVVLGSGAATNSLQDGNWCSSQLGTKDGSAAVLHRTRQSLAQSVAVWRVTRAELKRQINQQINTPWKWWKIDWYNMEMNGNDTSMFRLMVKIQCSTNWVCWRTGPCLWTATLLWVHSPPFPAPVTAE